MAGGSTSDCSMVCAEHVGGCEDACERVSSRVCVCARVRGAETLTLSAPPGTAVPVHPQHPVPLQIVHWHLQPAVAVARKFQGTLRPRCVRQRK
jgi:hypothetical protein